MQLPVRPTTAIEFVRNRAPSSNVTSFTASIPSSDKTRCSRTPISPDEQRWSPSKRAIRFLWTTGPVRFWTPCGRTTLLARNVYTTWFQESARLIRLALNMWIAFTVVWFVSAVCSTTDRLERWFFHATNRAVRTFAVNTRAVERHAASLTLTRLVTTRASA